MLLLTLLTVLSLSAFSGASEGLPDIAALESRPETINGTVPTENNGTSAYWIYGPVDGPRVVLLMGLAYTHYMWESTIIDLAVIRGWRVLAIDNRGVGKSAVTPGPYSIALMARDTKTALVHIGWLPPSDLAPSTPVHLVGISLGGMIVQELALENPNSFASIALVATYSGGNFFQTLPSLGAVFNLVEILALGDKDLNRQVKLLHTTTYLESHHDEVVTSLARKFQLGGFIERTALLAQVAAVRAFDVRSRIAELKGRVPAIVLVGSKDVLISPKRSQAIAKDLGCPIHIAEGAGHGLPDDNSAGESWFHNKLWEHLAAVQALLQ